MCIVDVTLFGNMACFSDAIKMQYTGEEQIKKILFPFEIELFLKRISW